MRRTRAILLLLLALLGAAQPARAQFFTMDADPGGLRWSSLQTPTYKLIFPRGLDSLARVYAVALEQAAAPVGASVGFAPNASYRRKMPVVMHAWTAYANGQVTWSPRRLELLTVPDTDAPEPTPWEWQLAVHESRHVAQMQFGAARPFRALNVLFGQLAPAAIAAMYPNIAFFEGDAVVAETALSAAGRGRTADFLEYYRVSFAAGDFRDYYRWRYGSQRLYTPDYYRAGYVAVGGIRALYDVPDLTARYYRRIADHHGIVFSNWNKTVREATGLRFRDAFAGVSASLQEQWAADEAARGPFLSSEAVSPTPKRFLEYTALEAVGSDLYALREGMTQPARLIRIGADGREESLALMNPSASRPRFSAADGRFFWAEPIRDARWPLRSYSVIRTTDGSDSHTLTRRTRYYHPMPAPQGGKLAATEYPVAGGSRIVVLDAQDGRPLESRIAPDGMQVVETVWVDDALYASAITDEGYGLYRADGFTPVLAPRPVKIKQLWSREGRLLFTCDLSGVNELYSLDPETGAAERLTTTRFGASDFEVLRDTLFYAALQPEGRLIRKTALSELQPQPADFSVLPKYPFAEELAAGEPLPVDRDAAVEVGEVQPYSKLGHLFRFHSWLPFYLNYESVDALSMATLQQDAGLGATAFFQNDLGTAYGLAGYHAIWSKEGWRHAGHFNFTYTGLYPVIEATVDAGSRDAYLYSVEEKDNALSLKTASRGVPSVSGSLRAYIPWNFSSGGWLRGLVPTLTLVLSNDRAEGGGTMQRTAVSLRAYAMQRTPASRVYPRFGIGAEAGYALRWTSYLIAPSAYGFLYGYLPGLHETHGLRWSALFAGRYGDAPFSEVLARTSPRGFGSDVSRELAACPSQFKGTLEYKLPLLPVDRAVLGPVAYLRNFELSLRGEYSAFSSKHLSGNLYSAGVDLTAVLGNLLWIPYPTRLGVSVDYNGGSAYETLAAQELPLERWTVSMLFSVDL